MTHEQAKEIGATHYTDTPMEHIYLRDINGWQCYIFGEWHSYVLEDGEIVKPL